MHVQPFRDKFILSSVPGKKIKAITLDKLKPASLDETEANKLLLSQWRLYLALRYSIY